MFKPLDVMVFANIDLLLILGIRISNFSHLNRVRFQIAKDMERWAKKVNVNKDVARPQAAQSTQEASKESTYQYDPNELKKVSKFQLKIK